MKFATLMAAGLAFATLGLGSAAEAQRHRPGPPPGHHVGPERHGPAYRGHARYDRHYRGRGHYKQQRCRIEYSRREHRRIRVCR